MHHGHSVAIESTFICYTNIAIERVRVDGTRKCFQCDSGQVASSKSKIPHKLHSSGGQEEELMVGKL